ncbi:hypothetical protein BCV69DRAFT_219651 [Microstroma glucosiphilum]|uniref:Uncharacterized protein n=1 Tax=Pseudomicrostroma glucosiphilum TaxID=1684307 RepID=A0A316U6Y0_9BASI|nr:hypothetical protein BCV69DRAFT_219651 [Pseudomicrostroma glucosiphilum]PWN20103.1 hypothetical protein BCV69DRAFT_219651 [Pseudomicrostroma glucosiphilum]
MGHGSLKGRSARPSLYDLPEATSATSSLEGSCCIERSTGRILSSPDGVMWEVSHQARLLCALTQCYAGPKSGQFLRIGRQITSRQRQLQHRKVHSSVMHYLRSDRVYQLVRRYSRPSMVLLRANQNRASLHPRVSDSARHDRVWSAPLGKNTT